MILCLWLLLVVLATVVGGPAVSVSVAAAVAVAVLLVGVGHESVLFLRSVGLDIAPPSPPRSYNSHATPTHGVLAPTKQHRASE